MVTDESHQVSAKVKPVAHQIIMVEWLDAEGESGWTDIKDCSEHKGVAVVSVGFLICENSTWVIIASTIRGEQCSSIDFIPVGCVLRRTVLWHPDTTEDWRKMWDKPYQKPQQVVA